MTQHVIPPRIYVYIYLLLLALLVATVCVSFVHLGWLNPVVAMSIAVVKALFIVLYFMHVRYSDKLTWIFVGGTFLWLFFLMSITMSDVIARMIWPF